MTQHYTRWRRARHWHLPRHRARRYRQQCRAHRRRAASWFWMNTIQRSYAARILRLVHPGLRAHRHCTTTARPSFLCLQHLCAHYLCARAPRAAHMDEQRASLRAGCALTLRMHACRCTPRLPLHAYTATSPATLHAPAAPLYLLPPASRTPAAHLPALLRAPPSLLLLAPACTHQAHCLPFTGQYRWWIARATRHTYTYALLPLPRLWIHRTYARLCYSSRRHLRTAPLQHLRARACACAACAANLCRRTAAHARLCCAHTLTLRTCRLLHRCRAAFLAGMVCYAPSRAPVARLAAMAALTSPSRACTPLFARCAAAALRVPRACRLGSVYAAACRNRAACTLRSGLALHAPLFWTMARLHRLHTAAP